MAGDFDVMVQTHASKGVSMRPLTPIEHPSVEREGLKVERSFGHLVQSFTKLFCDNTITNVSVVDWRQATFDSALSG